MAVREVDRDRTRRERRARREDGEIAETQSFERRPDEEAEPVADDLDHGAPGAERLDEGPERGVEVLAVGHLRDPLRLAVEHGRLAREERPRPDLAGEVGGLQRRPRVEVGVAPHHLVAEVEAGDRPVEVDEHHEPGAAGHPRLGHRPGEERRRPPARVVRGLRAASGTSSPMIASQPSSTLRSTDSSVSMGHDQTAHTRLVEGVDDRRREVLPAMLEDRRIERDRLGHGDRRIGRAGFGQSLRGEQRPADRRPGRGERRVIEGRDEDLVEQAAIAEDPGDGDRGLRARRRPCP